MDQSTGIHPVTVFKKPVANYLLAKVVLMDDLFEGNLNKYERLVRIEFIKTFSSKDPQKSFNIRQFFNTYRVFNQRSQINLYLFD